MKFPNFATHYHLNDKSPFLNLSDLSESELPTVLDDLGARQTSSDLKRVFGRRYMELRRLTEAKLRDLFVDVGGTPIRTAPHYFVLGTSNWFKGLSPRMAEVVVELSSLPSEVTSVTYPDSFAAMAFGPRFGLPQECRPYHEKVFRLEQLEELVSKYGLPEDDSEYDGYQNRKFEKYIEIQLWSDDPIRDFLSKAA